MNSDQLELGAGTEELKRLPCPEDYIGVVVEKTFSG